MKKQTLIFSFLFITILSFAVLVFNRANDIQEKTIQKIKIDRDTLDYFNEIAFGFEFNSNKEKQEKLNLKKWEKESVSINLKGNRLNPYLSSCLNNVITDFNNLSATTKLSVGSAEDIELYLIPVEEFAKIVPHYVYGNYGIFHIAYKNNAIYHSTILINSNDPSRDRERAIL